MARAVFNVCHLMPPGRAYEGLRSYRDHADAFVWALQALGYQASYSVNGMLPDAINILMGAQMDVMNRLLKTVPLDRDEWLICIAVSLSIIVVAEIRKFILRRQQEEVATG